MEAISPLLFEVEDGIARLTLNRPEHGNALTPELLVALEQAWARVESDPSIIVAIITGAGDRHFCTGAEVSALKAGVGALRREPYQVANRFSPRMCQVSKPVLCVVNGLANAGALNFIADSDIVIASATAALMDTHTSLGLVSALEQIGIARRAGVGAALLMALGGRSYRLPAERAYQLGIVDVLEPTPAAARARADELARGIRANSSRAMALSKRAIWGATELPDPAAAAQGWELIQSQWDHPDFEEGPKAFAEKRAARWDPDPDARLPLRDA